MFVLIAASVAIVCIRPVLALTLWSNLAFGDAMMRADEVEA